MYIRITYNTTCFLTEQSRRDDLEALGYTFLYYINGTLPWLELVNGEEIATTRYGEMKNQITVRELCKGLPG